MFKNISIRNPEANYTLEDKNNATFFLQTQPKYVASPLFLKTLDTSDTDFTLRNEVRFFSMHSKF